MVGSAGGDGALNAFDEGESGAQDWHDGNGDFGVYEGGFTGGKGGFDGCVNGGEPVADGFVGEPASEFCHGAAEDGGGGGVAAENA